MELVRVSSFAWMCAQLRLEAMPLIIIIAASERRKSICFGGIYPSTLTLPSNVC